MTSIIRLMVGVGVRLLEAGVDAIITVQDLKEQQCRRYKTH